MLKLWFVAVCRLKKLVLYYLRKQKYGIDAVTDKSNAAAEQIVKKVRDTGGSDREVRHATRKHFLEENGRASAVATQQVNTVHWFAMKFFAYNWVSTGDDKATHRDELRLH